MITGTLGSPAELVCALWRVKRVRLAILVMAGIGGLVALGGSAEEKVVAAEKYLLRDAGGKTWAEFSVRDGRPSLILFDEKGQPRTRLALAPDGAATLALFDKDGSQRAVLQVKPEGEPILELLDKNGKASAPPAPAAAPRAETVTELGERQSAVEALYRRLCASCHGRDGQATRARASSPSIPDFSKHAWQRSRSNAQLVDSILNGRGTEMPPFDHKVNGNEVRDLVTYIRGFDPDRAKHGEAMSPNEITLPGDFNRRFQQLQQEFERLKKEELSRPKPERNKDGR